MNSDKNKMLNFTIISFLSNNPLKFTIYIGLTVNARENKWHCGYKMNKSHRALVFSILPALTPLSCWSTWRQLDLSLIFLRSQILTVWSIEAVASSQSQWELNSTWVTFFLCSFKFHIYNGYTKGQMFFCCRAQDSGVWILGRENSSSHLSVLINAFKGMAFMTSPFYSWPDVLANWNYL